jgi:hypothetical protein
MEKEDRPLAVNEGVNISGGTLNAHALAVGQNAKVDVGVQNNLSMTQQDFEVLANELSRLRAAAKQAATDLDHDESVGALAGAEAAAKKGDETGVRQQLEKAGKWALDIATKIGTTVAVKAIEQALSL